MNYSTKVLVSAFAAGVVCVGVTSAPAFADTTSANGIVTSSLSSLGITIDEPALMDDLTSSVQSALDSGVVDPTIEPVPDATAAPSVEPTGEPTSEPITNPESTSAPHDNGLHLGHLHEQFDLWAMASPLWNAAFESIRVDFDVCVAVADPTIDCSAQTLTALQVAHADVLTSSYDELVSGIAALPAEQQAFAQGYLDRQLEHAQRRLNHALEEYATNPDGSPIPLTPDILSNINAEIVSLGGHRRDRADHAVADDPETQDSGEETGAGDADDDAMDETVTDGAQSTPSAPLERAGDSTKRGSGSNKTSDPAGQSSKKTHGDD